MLIHMKQHHFTEEELVQAYKPIAEYYSVVFHSMFTDQQDEQIERLQSTALHYIGTRIRPVLRMHERKICSANSQEPPHTCL